MPRKDITGTGILSSHAASLFWLTVTSPANGEGILHLHDSDDIADPPVWQCYVQKRSTAHYTFPTSLDFTSGITVEAPSNDIQVSADST